MCDLWSVVCGAVLSAFRLSTQTKIMMLDKCVVWATLAGWLLASILLFLYHLSGSSTSDTTSSHVNLFKTSNKNSNDWHHSHSHTHSHSHSHTQEAPLHFDFSHKYPEEYFNIQKGFYQHASTQHILFAVQPNKMETPIKKSSELFVQNRTSVSTQSWGHYYCAIPPPMTSPIWRRVHVSRVE